MVRWFWVIGLDWPCSQLLWIWWTTTSETVGTWQLSFGENCWMQTCLSCVLQIKITVGTLVAKYLMCLNDSDPWRTLYYYMKLWSIAVVTVNIGSLCSCDSKEYVHFSRSDKMYLVEIGGRGGNTYLMLLLRKMGVWFHTIFGEKSRFSPFSPTHAIKSLGKEGHV